MSTFIRWIAITEASTIERTATTIVMGRRIAVSTNHMAFSCVVPLYEFHSRLSKLIDERCQIAARLCGGKECTPDAHARYCIVRFGLGQQPLCLGDLGDVRQSTPIPRPRPALGIRRRLTFERCIPRDLAGRRHECAGLRLLRGEILDDLLVARALCRFILDFDALSRSRRKRVEDRNDDGNADRPVRYLQRQAITWGWLPWHLRPTATS